MAYDRISGRVRLILAFLLLVIAAAVLIVHFHRPTLIEPRPPLPPDTGLAQVQRTGVLRVGVDASYPPFEVAGPDGVVHGFDVDLANAVATGLGVRTEFLNLPLDELHDALIANKADVVISSWQASTAVQLAVSVPYYNAGLVLLVRQGAPPLPTDLASLNKGQFVGVELGSPGDEYFRQQGRPHFVREFASLSLAVDALTRGDVVAVVTDAPTAAALVRQHAALSAQIGTLPPTPYVIAAAPQNESLIASVNQVLSAMQASGELQRLIRYDIGG